MFINITIAKTGDKVLLNSRHILSVEPARGHTSEPLGTQALIAMIGGAVIPVKDTFIEINTRLISVLKN